MNSFTELTARQLITFNNLLSVEKGDHIRELIQGIKCLSLVLFLNRDTFDEEGKNIIKPLMEINALDMIVDVNSKEYLLYRKTIARALNYLRENGIHVYVEPRWNLDDCFKALEEESRKDLNSYLEHQMLMRILKNYSEDIRKLYVDYVTDNYELFTGMHDILSKALSSYIKNYDSIIPEILVSTGLDMKNAGDELSRVYYLAAMSSLNNRRLAATHQNDDVLKRIIQENLNDISYKDIYKETDPLIMYLRHNNNGYAVKTNAIGNTVIFNGINDTKIFITKEDYFGISDYYVASFKDAEEIIISKEIRDINDFNIIISYKDKTIYIVEGTVKEFENYDEYRFPEIIKEFTLNDYLRFLFNNGEIKIEKEAIDYLKKQYGNNNTIIKRLIIKAAFYALYIEKTETATVNTVKYIE